MWSDGADKRRTAESAASDLEAMADALEIFKAKEGEVQYSDGTFGPKVEVVRQRGIHMPFGSRKSKYRWKVQMGA